MTTLAFAQFVVTIEDPANPGSYIRPCGLTSKGFKRSANTSEATVPDCDDESAPGELIRGVVTLDWSIEGAVTIDLDDYDTWETQYEAGAPFSVQITRPRNGPGAGGAATTIYTGPALITTFDTTVAFGERAATGSITLTSAGKYVKTTT